MGGLDSPLGHRLLLWRDRRVGSRLPVVFGGVNQLSLEVSLGLGCAGQIDQGRSVRIRLVAGGDAVGEFLVADPGGRELISG